MTTRKRKAAPLLALATPAPTDREKVWAAMRQEKTFTQSRIAHLAGCGKGKVQDYLRGLCRAGFVRNLGEAGKYFTVSQYELVIDTGVDAPRVRTDGTLLPTSGRNRMWNTMRVLKVFTVDELVNAASLPESPIATSEAEHYCLWLQRGGYLAHTGGVFTFLQAKYTGAKAPQILRVKALFDPNLGEVVYQPAAEGRDDE